MASPQTPLVPEVGTILRNIIAAAVGDSSFQHSKVNGWTDMVIEDCVKQLAGLSKPVKYVVTVNVAQKAGAGMHVVSSTSWDEATDGKASVHWTNKEGVLVLATAYWVVM